MKKFVIAATLSDSVCPGYMRLAGHDVRMVSGIDEHGTSILIAAAEVGLRRCSWRIRTTASSPKTSLAC